VTASITAIAVLAAFAHLLASAAYGHEPLRLGRVSAPASWSNCSAGSNVADPGGVRGLFVATANQTRPSLPSAPVSNAQVLRYLVPNRTICGADLVIPWSAIDRGPGQTPRYDWSFLDQAAAPWVAAGKIVNLIVWGTDESTRYEVGGESATPAYVLSSTPTVSCGGRDPTVPVYWNPGYEKPWRAFEAALVAHVADDRSVGYIRFGLGTGGEDFPVDGFTQGACYPKWKRAGLTAATWLDWSTSEIDYEASLQSAHPLNVGINTFPGAPNLPAKVAAEAASHGIGFGMEGMTAKQIQNARSDPRRCVADWCSLFDTWAGRVPLEVQTYTASDPSGAGKTGALAPLLSYSVMDAHAQLLELYPQEWLVADDPDWPTKTTSDYARYHAAYAAALARAAAEVGGQPSAVIVIPPHPRPPCKGTTCM
jgi:hypothetical protein